MRAIAGAIIVLAGTLLLILAALLAPIYIAHGLSTAHMPIDPSVLLWFSIGVMAIGMVAVFPELLNRCGQK